jgi:DNA-directed RNA polymerase specialized sigma24 family protein
LLLLRFDQELSYREIGEILDMPETTAKSRAYRTLERLREILTETRERVKEK